MANPNPKTDHLEKHKFKKGDVKNPRGKTSKQRKLEIENAEKATVIRGKLLDALVEAVEGGVKMELIEASVLKLLKDTEDRGLGTAVQSVNVESPAGTMTPTIITRRIVDPDASEG